MGILLFKDRKGNGIFTNDFLGALQTIKADQCDVLYIHTSLTFGIPNQNMKKKELLGAICDIIINLGVKTVCMPTFTFSFCNGKSYNPQTSVSKMGVLNEFFRNQDGVERSLDPLLSVALYGDDTDLVKGIGKSSCGASSTFDKLRHRNNVKFLFLGPKIGDCMTYMHYLEWLFSVDYRYDRKFCGVVEHDGINSFEEYDLFVRYNGVFPNSASYIFEQRMYDAGKARQISFGDGTISIVDKDIATYEYKKCLDEDPHFFIHIKDRRLMRDKSFVLDNEMVAL